MNQVSPKQRTAQSAPDTKPKARVLIVDDRRENLFVLEELLSDLDVEVVSAASGTEALQLLLKDPSYSLILMDVQMPVLDGFETTKLIHQHPKTSRTPVIFITAIHKDAKYIHEGFESGAVDYICKPLDPKVLLSKVEIFIELDRRKCALEDALEDSKALEARKRLILDHSQDGIIAVDERGAIGFSNPAAKNILGCSDEKLRGKSLLDIIDYGEHQGDWSNSVFCDAIESGTAIRAEDSTVIDCNGRRIPCSYSFGTFSTHRECGGVLMFHDISQRKQAEEKLMYMATHDPLTKLPNRLLFRETIDGAMHRARRGGYRVIVMFIDLDHFKKVNDELGHTVGDELLITLSKRLKHIGRAVDLIARLGGDEFGMVFEDENGRFDVDRMAGRLLHALSKPIEVMSHSILSGASIGIVEFPEYGKDADALIKAADIAMYQAKGLGRNCYAKFKPEFENIAVERSQLERDFKQALLDEELTCCFQPILDCETLELRALEALVRWPHERRGMVSPACFIPIAENSGLIMPMSDQVLRIAFRAVKRWIELGLWPAGVRMSLNASAVQFRKGLIVQQLLETRKQFPVELSNFDIEITESLLLDDAEEVIKTLRLLRDKGVQISIDDFGTGYSSLSYLRRLPINTLKIDRGFIKDIGRDPDDECIIGATIDLAHNLNLQVVSEGVETTEQQAFLRSAGSDFVQGFLYAEPLSVEDAEQWLTDYRSKVKR